MIILITGCKPHGQDTFGPEANGALPLPVLSIDLLKMGLIRSGQTQLTPEDDELLTPYLWGIVSEMIKTAIENKQNLIVEGCYIPFDWRADFESEYLAEIEFCCLVMTSNYLKNHVDDIRHFSNVIENRLSDEIDVDALVEENEGNLTTCREQRAPLPFDRCGLRFRRLRNWTFAQRRLH